MLQSGFYAWATVALAMVIYLLNYSSQRKRLFFYYAALLTLWIAYILIIARTGVLTDFSLPPRIALLIVVPAIVGCIILTGRKSFREVLERTPPYVPVYFQSFRIVVEFLIYGAFMEGIFPERVTFRGINYDIFVGASAPVIAFLIQRGRISSKGLLFWNVISMLILSVTVYSFVSTYYFTDYVKQGGNTEFTELPYLLLASVLLPVAVFLHIFSLRQIIIARSQDGISMFHR
jgi:hypothetical protein